MVVPTEKRLIWHPRLDNKFLVGGGSQITLYEWVPECSEIKHVTSKQDLNLMKVPQLVAFLMCDIYAEHSA